MRLKWNVIEKSLTSIREIITIKRGNSLFNRSMGFTNDRLTCVCQRVCWHISSMTEMSHEKGQLLSIARSVRVHSQINSDFRALARKKRLSPSPSTCPKRTRTIREKWRVERKKLCCISKQHKTSLSLSYTSNISLCRTPPLFSLSAVIDTAHTHKPVLLLLPLPRTRHPWWYERLLPSPTAWHTSTAPV